MARAKEIEGFDCAGSINEGAVLVLRSRLEEMCVLRERALDFSDIEGVHDMRVASRRLRSALRDFARFVGGKAFPAKQLKALADTLGLVRDEDVAIQALEKLKDKATNEIAAGIAQIIVERDSRRERARESLEAMLTEERLAAMQEKYLARIELSLRPKVNTVANKRGLEANAVSFRTAGREIILARFRELEGLGSSLYRPLEADGLHRMRIAAKRLRYAIELFSSCWGGELAEQAKEVAELQSSLGELHDCDVWTADLGARLHKKTRAHRRSDIEGTGDDRLVRQAIVGLYGFFVKERARHFRAALNRWNTWEVNGFRERLSRILDSTLAEVELPVPAAEPVLRDVTLATSLSTVAVETT